MTYAVKEIFLHAAGRGRPGRPAGGVLPLRRLQSVERARAGPRQRRLHASATPTSSAWTAPAAASSRTPPTRWPPRSRRTGRRRRERPASSSAPAASRCCSSTRALIAALHARGFSIAVETNGTLAAPPGIDWICVSPKADAPLVQTRGQELKLVYPQAGARPGRSSRAWLSSASCCSRWTARRRARTPRGAIAYCLRIRSGRSACRRTR